MQSRIEPITLDLATGVLDWISEKTSELTCKSTNKTLVGGALLYAALDHFNAICYLLKVRAHSSAFALLRVQWQALINGLWIYLVCQDDQVQHYWSGGKEIPGLKRAIKAVESALPNAAQGFDPLTRLQVAVGKSMNIYTHMGAYQIQGLTQHPNEVGSSFPPEHVDGMLIIAVRIALYAATALSWFDDNAELEAEIEQKFLAFHVEIAGLRDAVVAATGGNTAWANFGPW